MLLIEETQHKIVTAKWANINQASEMPGIKIQKIASKFLNKHFKDLLDETKKEPAASETIHLFTF
jgi:hypothetical protein